MVRFFLGFLRSCYSIRETDIGLYVNCHADSVFKVAGIENWWLDALALPRAALRSSTVNRTSSASAGKRKSLPHGTARLVVCSTFVVQSIYGAIQEYAGDPEARWLD
jgi:hypothetical protein